MSLEPIEPQTALDLYLADRENNVTEATIRSHRSRLGHFIRWCDNEGIANLNDLTGRKLHRYRLWRRDEGDLAPATEKTQMDTLRVFIRWVESIDGAPEDLHVKIRSPTLTGDDNVRDEMLEEERAEELLEYLRRYEYASRPHVVIALMWHTMMRVGAIHSLDVDDFDPEEKSLEVVHRPETDTPIKNSTDGERFIALSDKICQLLTDWIEQRRPASVDEHGREPLVTTPQGRAHTTTLRGDCYRYTRPCISTGDCPHGRDIDECPATEYERASECPSSKSPHTLRRGGITRSLQQDWPMKAVGDRANVSERVLEMHYDQRTEKEKMEQRRDYLDQL
ncbi:tyrosine-type recombinase/integrase [Haloarcula sp. JP-Z28]|uniref:tyrosine-type recombinase/integrase n=1 Tax=Haloarcula sp. JP-Z28 TaxID=2716715 RepID=UPI0014044306|nr:site-specific integrase [Haloarcula sp. JP-Z28]NHN65830.1 tyrosine-type recombinase/integrase [Haloarcula sp. JP-Z28]